MAFVQAVARYLLNHFGSQEIYTAMIVGVLSVVAALALYEFVVYHVVLHRALYNKAFNISIAMIPFFISTIILCLQSNLIITLGTIGALAIIRFRTAVKDPVDMIFILWSIHIGITCGCQLFELALVTSIVVTVVLLGLNYVSFGSKSHILIVHTNTMDKQYEIEEKVKNHCAKYRVKCRNRTNSGVNLVIELFTKEANELAETVSHIGGVEKFSLMEYDPDDIL